MKSPECLAMILAGGQGSRLGALTKTVAKPAVPFGGKYRIIDFTLSNCIHSGIYTVGVLTQYQPLELNTYIGSGHPWDLNRNSGGVYVLPPYQSAEKGEWYKGTANAIYQNIEFVDKFNPKYVVILSGDHIYKMDYSKMIKFHKQKNADATIAVIEVPWEEASRFGIMTANEDGKIVEFAEKPAQPKSNLASMGVYVFTWEVLKKYLQNDEKNPESSNDFGKNIIPTMLEKGENMCAYAFEGYWKDVGTVQSLWEANMDILAQPPAFELNDNNWKIYSRNPVKPPHFVAGGAVIKNSCVTEGCSVYGTVNHSILFEGVTVEEGAVIEDSIIFPGTTVKKGATIKKTVVGEEAIIGEGAVIGDENTQSPQYESKYCTGGISLIGGGIEIPAGEKIGINSMVTADNGKEEN
ncbi:MAG: glucose-1-phosphate adenylyltransferase [Clostridia bacterium]|nr:glucose-1-phosphate adenylyltransferase [Clostridia bacterium]